ncbi:MAG: tetratricopeptide repeat protein, partial [Elusimicrobiota bacterium]
AQASVWLAELDLSSPAADARLTRVLAQDPAHESALLHRGAARLLRRRHEDAAADLSRFVERRPRSAAGQLLLGIARQRSGGDPAAAYARAAECGVWAAPHMLRAACRPREADAVADVDEALDCDPNYALVAVSQYLPGADLDDILRKLAVLACASPECFATFDGLRGLYRPTFPAEQLAACLRLRDLRPSRAWSWALLGRALMQGPRDPERAKDAFAALDRAVALRPEAGWAYSWRAQAFIAANELERALADYDECAVRQPFYHRGYAWRGALLRKLGRPREAIVDLDRAIAMDPEYHFGWRERSLAWRDVGELTAAGNDLGRAYRLKSKYEWGVEVRGGAQKNRAPDIAELSGEIERRGGPAILLAWRGHVKLQSRDLEGAVTDFKAALKLDPRCALARGWLGQAHLQAKHYGRACLDLRRALELDPHFWMLHAWLATAEFENGRPREAFTALRRLLRIRPRAAWAHALTADLHLRSKNFKKAAVAAEKAAAIDGQHGQAHLLAARARFELGDIAEAERHVARAVELLPGSAEVRAVKDFFLSRTR